MRELRAPTAILATVEGEGGLNWGKLGNLDRGRFQSIGCENYKFSKCHLIKI